MRISRLVVAATSGYCLLALAGAPSRAAGTDTGAETIPGGLAEVTVTARKRAESIQEVPSSLVAIGADRLQADAVASLADLAALVPGVNLNGYEPNKATISIRGVTSTNPGVGGFSPTVGFFIDDVALEIVSHDLGGQVEPPLFDLQRVEVLKGPQGTLYGGSAMGGAIKLVSAKPELDRAEVKVGGGPAFTQGGSESFVASTIANLPLISDHAALRFGLYYDYAGGYIDRVPYGSVIASEVAAPASAVFASPNVVAERDINAYTTKAARIALAVAPSPALKVTADVLFQQQTSGNTSDFQPNLGLRQSFVLDQPTRDQLTVGILTIVQSLQSFDLTSVSSLADSRDTLQRDFTFFVGGLVPDFATLPSPDFEGAVNNTYSQELRITSTDADSRLQYVAGAYFRRQSTRTYQNVETLGSGVTEPGVPSDVVYEDVYHFSVRQLAGFGELTYRLGSWDLTAGARVYDFHLASSKTGDGLFNGGPVANLTGGSDSGVSPKAEIAYHLDSNRLLYALANRGFRPGGANTAGLLPAACDPDLATLGLQSAPLTYQSDSLWNYELGSKNTFAGGNATVNAAFFYMDWRNIQQGVTLPCGFGFTANLGAAVSKGVELDLLFQPQPGLKLGASATYDDAYVSRAAPGTGINAGDPIQEAPKWTGNALADYTVPLSNGRSIFTHWEYQFRGGLVQGGPRTIETPVDPLSGASFSTTMTVANPAYESKSYRLLTASVGLRTGGWTVRALVENLTNTQPLLAISPAGPGVPLYTPTLRPRTLRLRVDAQF